MTYTTLYSPCRIRSTRNAIYNLYSYRHIITLIFTYFNSHFKYIIKIDLSDYMLGGVLLQYNQNSELYLVVFPSKNLFLLN